MIFGMNIDIIIVLVSLSALVFSLTAYMRFSSGQIKNVMKWIIATFVLLQAYKVLEIAEEQYAFKPFGVEGAYDYTFLLATLSFVMTFVEMDRMSRVLGFTDFEDDAVKFFEENSPAEVKQG